MGKFKVGDRVRRIRYLNSEEMKIGDTGTVTEVDAAGDCRVKPDKGGDDQFNFARYLELVAAAPTAWQPKVGDRVVSDDEDTRGEVGTVVEGGYGYPGLIMVKFDTWRRGHDGVNLYGNSGKEHWLVQTKDLQPVPAPAHLTIAAGGYYKTSDGRKVGPMSRATVGWFYVENELGTWRKDGTAHSAHEPTATDFGDLVAEWVDEPAIIKAKYVGEQPASNDNAAPAKFKVGDRVRALVDWGSIKKGKIYTIPYLDKDGEAWLTSDGAGGWNDYLADSELELVTSTTTAIVALIENGVALPSSRPVVHASQEAATTEASRLALLHPGQAFGVFVLADSKIADVVEEIVKKTVLRAA